MSDVQRGPRLLVFIVAYYAESTLTSVLQRIPAKVRDDFDCEILVVDDASEDRTYALGREYQQAHPEIRMTVLRNELNQGYGGNQKIGYTFAIERGFDFVVLLHGDGQYAPEEMPRLLEPAAGGPRRRGVRQPDDDRRSARCAGGCRSTSTSATGCSRTCRTRCCARESQRVPQRLPRLLGAGAAADPVSAQLERLPLRHRDHHPAAQRRAADRRAADPDALRRRDLLRRRRPVRQGRPADDVPAGRPRPGGVQPAPVRAAGRRATATATTTSSSATRAATSSRSTPCPTGSRVLDIGAGPGRMAQELVAKGCEVTVVDQFPAPDAPGDVEVLQQDLDDPPVFDARKYDHLLMLDVIEHLKDPEVFLEQLVDQFDYGPRTLVLTTPNVAFATQRLMLALRAVQLRQRGDPGPHAHAAVHLPQPARLLVDSGFRLREVRGVPAPWPKVLGDGALGRLAVRVNELLIRAEPDAVLLPDLRRGRLHPERRLRAGDSQSRSDCRTRIISGSALEVRRGRTAGGSSAIEAAGGSLPGRRPAGRLLAAGLCAVGAVATGAAVQVDDGYQHPLAFVWLTVAVAAVLLAVVAADPPHDRGRARPGSLPPVLVVRAGGAAVGDAAAVAGPAVRRRAGLAAVVPGRRGGRRGRGWSRSRPDAGSSGTRHLALLATHLALGVWTIRVQPAPSPMIDVFMFQRDAAAALLSGDQPVRDHLPQPVPEPGPTTGRTWSSTAGSCSGSRIRR